MNDTILKQYAEIILYKGINLYPNQCLNILTDLEHYPFALIVAELAYQNKAKMVTIDVGSNLLTKYRIDSSDENNLDFVPNFITGRSFEFISNDWAFLRIDNTEEMDILKDADPNRLQRIQRAQRLSTKRFTEELMGFKHTWCIAAVPGPKWAGKVFPDVKPAKQVEKMWEALIPILRLDTPDPLKAWDDHGKMLNQRCKMFNERQFETLRFLSKDTELEIGLNKTSIWKGGPSLLPSNRLFFPNLPTEEIFTTPDYSRTNGHTKVTRPVKVMEQWVENAQFVFKAGKVVEYHADKGKDILDRFINFDDGASFLGEVALVDAQSPIFKSKLLFNNILYDENAASHIALGAGYAACLSNAHQLNTDDDRKIAGCNISMVHTDFMIGSSQMDVVGIDRTQKEIQIMKSGSFVLY